MISIERYLLISKLFRSFQKSVNSSIVQLFGIKKDNWLISPSLKKQNKTKQSKKTKTKCISWCAPKVNETLPVVLQVVRNKEKANVNLLVFPVSV